MFEPRHAQRLRSIAEQTRFYGLGPEDGEAIRLAMDCIASLRHKLAESEIETARYRSKFLDLRESIQEVIAGTNT